MNLQERVREIAKLKTEGNISVFQIKCGLSNGFVSKIREGTSKYFLNQILTTFPDVNPKFLFNDELPVLLENKEETEEVLRKDNEFLKKEVEYLKELNESLRKTIQLLETNK